MADVPTFRMAVTKKSFANSGCDYFGLFISKEGRNVKIAWDLLFTCMTTRPVHVELVTSMDLRSFILAFSRFMNLGEPVSSIYSENGTTFKAAAYILPQLLQSEELQSFLGKGIVLGIHSHVQLFTKGCMGIIN